MLALIFEVAALRSEISALLFYTVLILLELLDPVAQLSLLEFAVFCRRQEAAQKTAARVERVQPETVGKPNRTL